MPFFGSHVFGNLAGYNIANAALFNGSTGYLSRTFGSAGGDTWSFSLWVQKCSIPAAVQFLFSNAIDGNVLLFYSDEKLSVNDGTHKTTTAVFRDPTAMSHILLTGNGTLNKLYVDGELQTLSGAPNITNINTAVVHTLMRYTSSASYYFNGYVAEVRFVDGQELTPADFGETDAATGNWKAKRYAGTYGTNGFYLDFSNSGALGTDASGNGNNWTVNGTITQVTSTPTNVYATLNPLDKSANVTLSNGNKSVSITATASSVRCTQLMSSGKWYWEVHNPVSSMVGIADGVTYVTLNSYIGGDTHGWGYYFSNGNKYTGGVSTAYGATYTNTDIIGVAFDADAGTLEFFKNNVSQGTAYTGLTSGPYFAALGNGSMTANLITADADFTYTPPTGFKSISTDNLPVPTIKNWKDVHAQVFDTEANVDATLAAAISAQGWGADPTVTFRKNFPGIESWSWVFSYDASNEHTIAYGSTYQTLRAMAGTNNWLGAAFRINATYGTYAAAISHTSGGGNTTVTHSLNASRYAVLLFPRAGGAVYMWHPDLTAGNLLDLTSTAVQAASTRVNTFGVNTFLIESAAPTDTYDVLVLAETDVVKLSKHTGNGSADGPYTNVGISPVLDICKIITGTANYYTIHSAALDADNPADQYLIWNYDNAGGTTAAWDWTSGGRKIRTTGVSINASGSVFMNIQVGNSQGPTENPAR